MIYESQNIQDFLMSELDRRLQHNPRYSQRAFARDLKLSPGALSEIVNGKRAITAKLVFKIEKALGLTETEVSHLLSLLGQKKKGEEASEVKSKKEMSLQFFRVISEWYHMAILNLTDLKGFQWDPQWIAQKLGISFVQARGAMKRLQEMEMVEKKAERVQRVHDFAYSGEEVPSSAIRQYHSQMLEKCMTALETQSVDERSFYGTGMTIKNSDLKKIKKEVADFHDQLVKKYSKKSGDQVYHYQSGLIRVTNHK